MSQASAPLAVANLSKDRIEQLKQHPHLLEALDQWVLFADRRLIPEIQALGQLMRAMYDFPDEILLYRGFRLGSFQDGVGFDQHAYVGQTKMYENDERALSFSTDINIARAFGNVVVSTSLNTQRGNYLVITDDLNAIIHEQRNLKDLVTQKEVILLPTIRQQLRVVQFEKTTFGWAGW